MSQKRAFLITAIIASVLLLIACTVITVWEIIRSGSLRVDAIGLINLLVDIVAGFFTIWGLYWAASEFAEGAVKPVIRLLPAQLADPFELGPPARRPPFRIRGRCNRSSEAEAFAHLYLENTTSRAGRYVRAVINIRTNPKSVLCEFRIFPKGEPVFAQTGAQGYPTLSLIFEEQFVVYPSPICIGWLHIRWLDEIGAKLPRKVSLDYNIYTLDGVSHGQIDLLIKWDDSRQSASTDQRTSSPEA